MSAAEVIELHDYEDTKLLLEAKLNDVTSGLDVIAANAAEVPEAVFLADLLFELGQAKKRLGEAYREVEKSLLAEMGTDEPLIVEGRGAFKARHGTGWKEWKNETLLEDIRPKVVHDSETGELLDGEQVWNRLVELYGLQGGKIRLGVLKDVYGFNPRDYAVPGKETWAVQLPSVDWEDGW